MLSPRPPKNFLSSIAAVALSLVVFVGRTPAQTAGQPSTSKGDWPYYFADAKGTRYSPQDQINAANFNQLEVACVAMIDRPMAYHGMVFPASRN